MCAFTSAYVRIVRKLLVHYSLPSIKLRYVFGVLSIKKPRWTDLSEPEVTLWRNRPTGAAASLLDASSHDGVDQPLGISDSFGRRGTSGKMARRHRRPPRLWPAALAGDGEEGRDVRCCLWRPRWVAARVALASDLGHRLSWITSPSPRTNVDAKRKINRAWVVPCLHPPFALAPRFPSKMARHIILEISLQMLCTIRNQPVRYALKGGTQQQTCGPSNSKSHPNLCPSRRPLPSSKELTPTSASRFSNNIFHLFQKKNYNNIFHSFHNNISH